MVHEKNAAKRNKIAKKPLTESRTPIRGPFTGRERRFKRQKRPVANIDGQQSPGRKNRGTMVVRLILSLQRHKLRQIWVGGSLTLLVLDEGTCGRRRLLLGLQGSGWQFKLVVTITHVLT